MGNRSLGINLNEILGVPNNQEICYYKYLRGRPTVTYFNETLQ